MESDWKPLARPGETCWQMVSANHVRLLVDGEEYFATVREALLSARQSIWLMGWDFHTRLQLVRPNPRDGAPVELQALLKFVLEQNPFLHIYFLAWDYSWIYAREREFTPLAMRAWCCHPRLHFALDGRHPLGASHHQKVVVVDDQLAFSGGFDLTSHRWDRRSHLPADPLRKNADGRSYQPFHDVQMAVSGAAAQALGALARKRWQAAAFEKPLLPHRPPKWNWPEAWPTDFTNVDVAISRTMGPCNSAAAVTEVEKLHLETIRSARHYLYIENQYFTSDSIATALLASLQKSEGPEIVLVISEISSGWLEEMTMDVLRSRWFERLREADQHHRLRIYHPLSGKRPITVHSKLVIADDRFLRVGSANLSNRSMEIDSECDLSVDAAANPHIAPAIRNRCLDLLSEHLDTPIPTLQSYWTKTDSLIQTIEHVRGRSRTLVPYDEDLPLWLDELVELTGNHQVERPRRTHTLMRWIVGLQKTRWRAMSMLGLIALLMTVWLSTSLQEHLRVAVVLDWLQSWQTVSNVPVWLVGAELVVSFFAAPVWVFMLLTWLILSPTDAFVVSWIGAMTAAVANYWAARLLGRKLLRGYLSYDLKQLSRQLRSDGVRGLLWMRLHPGASFTLVNLVAGASVMRFYKFLVGSALGFLPVIVATGLFKEALRIWLQTSTAAFTFGFMGFMAILYALYRLRRSVRSRSPQLAMP